jgi:hypothetical protein
MANSAPSVEIFNRSFSQTVEPDSDVVFATLGLFARGPVNELTLLNNPQDLRDIFGVPVDSVTAKFFFPIDQILEIAPVYVVRVEDGDKKCAGSTVGISGSSVVAVDTPVEVSAYPVSYESVFQTGEDSEIEIDPDELNMSSTISVLAAGPGESYENVGYSIVNYSDYNR